MRLFALLLAETPTVSGDNIVTLGTLGTVIGGIVAWVLKSALPKLLEKAEAFITKFEQLSDKKDEAAKAEREAAKAERAHLIAAQNEQLNKREETCQRLVAVVSELTAEVKAGRAVSEATLQALRDLQGQAHHIAPEPRTKPRGN